MKTRKTYLSVAFAAALMFGLNAHATTSTTNTAAKAPSITPGGVAPSGLTDDEFKAGLLIERDLKTCKKMGGTVDKVVKVDLVSEPGNHLMFALGTMESDESVSLGEYKLEPSKKQIKSLVGRKFCNF